MTQWLSVWLETERPRVRASPASLRCGLRARHIYPSLVLVQPRKTRPCLTERLLMGRKKSNQTNKTDKFLALNFSDAVFILLINVKMPTIVGILTFMSRINFVLSWVEHEKCFITSGPDTLANGEDPDEMLHYEAFHHVLHCFINKNNL